MKTVFEGKKLLKRHFILLFAGLIGTVLSAAAQQKYSAYLFAYFTGNGKNDEAIRFAISNDGYNFRALNGNKPVILSEKISSTGGVRDPHILRGHDGKTFYMVATDMVSANGWDSNRAMVLMKSTDLINWTSSVVNIQKKYPGQDSLLRVWAPQTIYDVKAGKYMIYFSMKHGSEPDKIYYAYANADFTDLESEPKQLFFSPTNGACIDGDIIVKDGKYHLFFKTEGEGAGIKIAVSDKLTEGYVLHDKYVQQTKDPVEGAGVFKLNNSDEYILMYDVYTKGRYQFTKSKDLQNFSVIDQDVTMNFHPRHGAVMPITAKEAETLIKKMGIADVVISPAQSAAIKKIYSDSLPFNPIIRDKFTADPAALVHNDTVYLYTGHDEAPKDVARYVMNEWLCYSSSDMVHWKEHPSPLNVKAFSWAKADAWASQVIYRNGKFYWYVAVEHGTIGGKTIGVAVSDKPTGPFKDALGKAIVTNDMTKATGISWDDIDPSVIIDDGQAYLFWGNTKCYYAKLKENMIELDGPINVVEGLPNFTEAPWIHKRGDWYYLSYAYQFPEKIAYAMSKNIHGPWQYKGILNEVAGNSNTNHQSIIEFKGKWYFIYHNGALADHGGFHRSVCIDRLYYNKDGTLKRVVMTSEGAGVGKNK